MGALAVGSLALQSIGGLVSAAGTPAGGSFATLPKYLGRPETLLADNGYFSEANVTLCAAANIEPEIVAIQFEQVKRAQDDLGSNRSPVAAGLSNVRHALGFAARREARKRTALANGRNSGIICPKVYSTFAILSATIEVCASMVVNRSSRELIAALDPSAARNL